MCQNLFAIDWAKHAVVQTAMVLVPKSNPSQSSHISMRSTKNILCRTCSVHAQYYQPHARVQIGWVLFPNRIRQT